MASKITVVIPLPTLGVPVRLATAAGTAADPSKWQGVSVVFQNTTVGGGNIFLGDDATVTTDAGLNPGYGLYGVGGNQTFGTPPGASYRHIQLQDWWAVGSGNTMTLVAVLIKS